MGRRPVDVEIGTTPMEEQPLDDNPTSTHGEPPPGLLPDGTLNVVGQDDEMTDEEEGE